MLHSLISRGLGAAERRFRLPGSMEYLRHVARASAGAFAKFALFLPLSAHGRRVPAEALAAARLAATLHQDCGTCVQIVLAQARQQGVSPPVLQALLDDRVQDVPGDARLAFLFARAVSEQSADAQELRESVRTRFGEDGLVELALATATAQVFPLTKRALGLAQSCSAVPLRAEPEPERATP